MYMKEIVLEYFSIYMYFYVNEKYYFMLIF